MLYSKPKFTANICAQEKTKVSERGGCTVLHLSVHHNHHEAVTHMTCFTFTRITRPSGLVSSTRDNTRKKNGMSCLYAVICSASSKLKTNPTDEPRKHRLGTEVCFKQTALPAKPGTCFITHWLQVQPWCTGELQGESRTQLSLSLKRAPLRRMNDTVLKIRSRISHVKQQPRNSFVYVNYPMS